MANVSQYLQAPGTPKLDVHEKALPNTDLKQTIIEENLKSRGWIALAAMGFGIGIGNCLPVILIGSVSSSPKENAIRLGIGFVSLSGSAISLLCHTTPHNHVSRAVELLSGEIGDRPPDKPIANPANYS